VELQTLLSKYFEMLSFVEDPEAEVFFDYRLRSGASQTGNAIRLLEKIGFPAEIVEDAMSALSGGGPIESTVSGPHTD
jgi:DNA mismatch repair ATPase MutS